MEVVKSGEQKQERGGEGLLKRRDITKLQIY